MIQVEQLIKRYGDTAAVDGMTFTVHPGRVTGFLGPNGAGKSTTMRVMLGLDPDRRPRTGQRPGYARSRADRRGRGPARRQGL